MQDQAKPKMSTGMRLLLAGSLGLNLLVAGIIVGLAVRGPAGYVDGPLRGPAESIRALTWALPAEHRRNLGDAMRDHRDDFRARRQEQDQLRLDFTAAIRAEPFVRDDVVHLLRSQHALWDDLTGVSLELLADTIAGMSTADRAVFAANLHHPRGNRRWPGARTSQQRPIGN